VATIYSLKINGLGQLALSVAKIIITAVLIEFKKKKKKKTTYVFCFNYFLKFLLFKKKRTKVTKMDFKLTPVPK